MSLESEKDAFHNIKNIVKPFFDLMVKIDRQGLENLPETGPGILVGNHRSDMDPLVVGTTVPRYISWIAAEYTKRIPVLKSFIDKTGIIPMDIDGNVSVSSIKRIMYVLKKGELLGIFPEGHDYMVRNDFSGGMVDFHPGFATFAYRTGAPIIPFSLIPLEENLTTIPVPPAVRSFMGLPEEVSNIPHRVNYKSVRIVFGKQIDVTEYRKKPEKEACPQLAALTREKMQEIQVAQGMASA